MANTPGTPTPWAANLKDSPISTDIKKPIFAGAGILIVDDEPRIVEMIYMLCQQAGFKHIFTALDGIEALKILQRHSSEIDLLSLDIRMRGMSGLKVAEIVANTHDRIVGLVMVTGFGTEEAKKQFLALETEVGLAEKFVEKPFDAYQIINDYAEALTDVLAKRDKQLEVGVNSSLKHIQASLIATAVGLSSIQDDLASMTAKIDGLKQKIEEHIEKPPSRPSNDLNYVWALAAIFLLVTCGLAWASMYFKLPLLSVLALTSVTILVLMLIAVFDLSKGGKLSEKSLMEVIRKAFAFIARKRK
jgi:CheY-like chemotaxis protein